jgi:hypothetical protein
MMDWRKNPKIADARDLAKKWDKSHVVFIMIDDNQGTIEYITYGKNKTECKVAHEIAKAIEWAVGSAWSRLKGQT